MSRQVHCFVESTVSSATKSLLMLLQVKPKEEYHGIMMDWFLKSIPWQLWLIGWQPAAVTIVGVVVINKMVLQNRYCNKICFWSRLKHFHFFKTKNNVNTFKKLITAMLINLSNKIGFAYVIKLLYRWTQRVSLTNA